MALDKKFKTIQIRKTFHKRLKSRAANTGCDMYELLEHDAKRSRRLTQLQNGIFAKAPDIYKELKKLKLL